MLKTPEHSIWLTGDRNIRHRLDFHKPINTISSDAYRLFKLKLFKGINPIQEGQTFGFTPRKIFM